MLGMSFVTRIPAAPAHEALGHFEARLRFEADAADVGAAIDRDEVDFTLIDVRSKSSYEAGHIPGALSIPHQQITADKLPEGPLVVYCWGPGCNGALHGAAKIAALGREVKEMLGGWEYYVREGWPVEGERTDLYEADGRGLVSVP
jgi:rhodanese-related sulfurtransferase